ncbi:MAG: DNA alkylation repair protein [Bifidobacteriaceae bacterium]|jgi:hypothetical protein|nr:DNA alkylation repair protein [Bifidobacteriaceae bacterium]
MKQIRQRLNDLSQGNEQYANFHRKIIKTKQTILGVRIPDMRQLAKFLSKQYDFLAVKQLSKSLDKTVYEEILLLGLIINYSRLQPKQKQELLLGYFKMVDNWAEIDCVIIDLKNIADIKTWWEFAMNCLTLSDEFTVRWSVVFLMKNFINDDKLIAILTKFRDIKQDGYYVKMALAWFYATAAINYFTSVMQELKNNQIDLWIKRQTYQKMLDSYRITKSKKQIIRQARQLL